jgi:two-component system, chemotaxis family, chemotaxis protein CheY
VKHDFATKRVLLVDDFSTMRRIVKTLLLDIGFSTIAEADDGYSALEELARQDIELIVADCNMPKIGGAKLLATIRDDAAVAAIPFLLIASDKEEREAQAATATQPNADYLIKPFNAAQLRKKIAEIT